MAMRKSDEELEILAHLGNCRSTGEVSLMVMGTAWKAVGSGIPRLRFDSALLRQSCECFTASQGR